MYVGPPQSLHSTHGYQGGWYVSRLRGRERERERGKEREGEKCREGEREGRREGRRRRRRRGSKKVEHFEHLVLFGSECVCGGEWVWV